MNQQQLTDYAENTGTLLNAYTSREHTSYYFQGKRENTQKLVEILADIIQNPDLSLQSIRNERSVIVAEYDGKSRRISAFFRFFFILEYLFQSYVKK